MSKAGSPLLVITVQVASLVLGLSVAPAEPFKAVVPQHDRFRALVKEGGTMMEEYESRLEPYRRDVRELETGIARQQQALGSCLRQVKSSKQAVGFVAVRLSRFDDHGAVSIGHRTYDARSIKASVSGAQERVNGQRRRCNEQAGRVRELKAELRSKQGQLEARQAKLASFRRVLEEQQERWEKAGKERRDKELDEQLDVGSPRVLSTNTRLGYVLYELERLVSTREALTGDEPPVHEIDLSEID